jgi:hypothetical protein
MANAEKVRAGLKDEADKAGVEYEAIQDRIGETDEYPELLSKVQITRLALIQRLDRNLMQDLRQLRKSRSPHTRISLGDYHIPDVYRNFIVKPHTTDDRMEEIARQLGILQKWEKVEK